MTLMEQLERTWIDHLTLSHVAQPELNSLFTTVRCPRPWTSRWSLRQTTTQIECCCCLPTRSYRSNIQRSKFWRSVGMSHWTTCRFSTGCRITEGPETCKTSLSRLSVISLWGFLAGCDGLSTSKFKILHRSCPSTRVASERESFES